MVMMNEAYTVQGKNAINLHDRWILAMHFWVSHLLAGAQAGRAMSAHPISAHPMSPHYISNGSGIVKRQATRVLEMRTTGLQ